MNTSFEVSKENTTTTWLTPPDLLAKLGPFELDPCAAIGQPWRTATTQYTEKEDGLKQDWGGRRAWMNPPYGNKEMPPWMQLMAWHNHGTALMFTRLETEMCFDFVWPHCTGILVIKKRIPFYTIEGKKGGSPGCGSILIAYGEADLEILRTCGIAGQILIPERK